MIPDSILVADDHPMLLKGLCDELKGKNYNVIGAAIDGGQAIEFIIKDEPNIAIIDIEMPVLSGFEVISESVAHGVCTKFIILTSHKEKAFVLKAKKFNIQGYLLKDEPFTEIEKCIKRVASGASYFSNSFDHILKTQIHPEMERIRNLSPSERTITKLIANGKTSKEISEELSISIRTVQKHRANIIKKLELPPSSDSLHQWAKENIELLFSI
ncbi:response regulator [Jejudonia soesokkakensis]|uniref:Response regulator n=1 Tax=Jejudonia soesokkakensis TaxID=1323432 RepID=A0ABW2MWP1_9FLAO